MKSKYLFISLATLILAGIVTSYMCLSGNMRICFLGGEGLALIIMLLLYRSILKPVIAAQSGLDLLSAQDFNNRLVKVGEPGADKIVKLFNDLITRLKNERLRLREQDTFLRLLVEASPMGVILLNLDDKVVMANAAFMRISGMKHEEVLGNNFRKLSNDLAQTLSKIRVGESEIVRYNGSGLYRCYHLSFIQEGFRRHFYLVESLTEEVRKAEKDAYEKVIRMISHEVNNTMGSVESVFETLADDSEDDPVLHATIKSCLERCESMCSFIDSFADLARIPEPELLRVNLDTELTKMMPFFRLMAPENVIVSFNNEGLEVADREKDRKFVKADISMLQQALINIVKNAIESISELEHSENKSRVMINTTIDKGAVTLEIANNGKPISPDVEANLFNTFFSTKRMGRGLGLTLISEILRKHSCSFTLRTDPSESPINDTSQLANNPPLTRFTIHFPHP